MLYIIPPLPVKDRYTEQWLEYWDSIKPEHIILNEDTESKSIDRTKEYNYFTNTEDAISFELAQLQRLFKFPLNDNDVVLFLDMDFPGFSVCASQLIKTINPNVRTYAYQHAGSYCNGDIFSRSVVCGSKQYSEMAGNLIFDKIFFATEYHRDLFSNSCSDIEKSNLSVVGFPFNRDDFVAEISYIHPKDKSGVFISGRPEQSIFMNLYLILEQFPDVKFYINQKLSWAKKYPNIYYIETNTRNDYIDLINKCKILISCKVEETFGLSVVEAVALGTLPLVPNDFSYPEILNNETLFMYDVDDFCMKFKGLLDTHIDLSSIHLSDINKYSGTVSKMLKEMYDV